MFDPQIALVMAVAIAAVIPCIRVAGRMASARRRSRQLWMLLAASFGLIPLGILALLPGRRA